MATVCQKCGDVGYADLLVYCNLCHEAAQHQYCLETIPRVDEDVRWACEGCNFSIVNSKCFKNDQGGDNDFSINPPNVHSHQEGDENLVSNESYVIISDPLCDKDPHVVQCENGPKAWGKTNKRSVRSKQIAKAYNNSSRNVSATFHFFGRFKPNKDDDFTMCDIEKESSLGVFAKRSHFMVHRRKLVLVDEDDDLIEKDTTSQPLDVSKPNARRRKLVLLDEDDFSIDDGIENDSCLAIDHSLECVRHEDRRRKLVLPDESDDSIDANENDTLSKYVVLENVISMDQFLEKDERAVNLVRKLISSNDNDGLNDLEACSLKDLEVGLILVKINREIAEKTKSGEGQIDLLASSLEEANHCSKSNDSMLVLLNQVDKHDGLEASLSHKTNDEMTRKTNCPCDSTKMATSDTTKMASHIVVGDDEQLQKVATMLNVHDSMSLQNEFCNMPARPMNSTCWRGWFKISGRYYGPLIAHWSTKIGEKAWNATRSLPQIVELTMVSRSRAWPKSFDKAPPTDGDIALFFFPQDLRAEKMLDLLLDEVIRCNLMLKVALDEAEMLVLPSVLLPDNYHRFQDKYYLWGVCKRKDSDANAGEVIGIQNTNENSTKQVVPIPLIESEEFQRDMGNEAMHLDGDELQESLCPRDEGGDEEMSGHCGKDGCLELFPMQVEDIALRLKMGDGEMDVDLDLGLRLPFTQ
ncbi:RING/FYVE/PHD zinc finger superfamily protein [Rhynchospora pubera]|uniref:RING/FYVE/PHD zinc finger superfamily protein n=1 Tax=Rhynchospora pubera TaxID=906938 RepID=A0AAV8FQP2_9POAL|nr:RING/FYVE/PHD zinc finger superfamily protein [Rhynchospora pubera]